MKEKKCTEDNFEKKEYERESDIPDTKKYCIITVVKQYILAQNR